MWDLPGPGIKPVWILYYWTTRKILSSVLHNKILCFILFFRMGLESCWKPAESCSILPYCQWEICIEHNDGPKTRCYCPCLGTGFCPMDFCAGLPLASAWSYGNSSALVLKTGPVFFFFFWAICGICKTTQVNLFKSPSPHLWDGDKVVLSTKVRWASIMCQMLSFVCYHLLRTLHSSSFSTSWLK